MVGAIGTGSAKVPAQRALTSDAPRLQRPCVGVRAMRRVAAVAASVALAATWDNPFPIIAAPVAAAIPHPTSRAQVCDRAAPRHSITSSARVSSDPLLG